jgi:two-component system phosphate regulon response regulator PhoB
MTLTRPIVIVGRNESARRALRTWFEREHWVVREAEEPVLVLLGDAPELVVACMDGEDAAVAACSRLRHAPVTRGVPILVCGVRPDARDALLEAGADDVLGAPNPRELVARVRALLRRRSVAETPPREVFERGRLRIDFDAREVRLDGRPLHVPLRDFALLRFFVEHPNRVHRREEVLAAVWGRKVRVEPRTVDAHVRRLRRLLAQGGAAAALVTVRGVGYRLDPSRLGD